MACCHLPPTAVSQAREATDWTEVEAAFLGMKCCRYFASVVVLLLVLVMMVLGLPGTTIRAGTSDKYLLVSVYTALS